jgi:hypothetical protein
MSKRHQHLKRQRRLRLQQWDRYERSMRRTQKLAALDRGMMETLLLKLQEYQTAILRLESLLHGEAWLGPAGRGMARQGKARHGRAGQVLYLHPKHKKRKTTL